MRLRASARAYHSAAYNGVGSSHAVYRKHGRALWQLPRHIQRPSLAAQAAGAGELVTWLLEKGSKINGVELVYEGSNGFVTNRELRATRVIVSGEVIISVPSACQVRYIDASDVQLLQLMEKVPRASGSGRGAWQFKMALQLAHHLLQGPSSPLAPYLAHLPGQLPGIPSPLVAMGFPPEHLRELQDAELAADAEGQAYWAGQFSKEVLEKLPGSEHDPFHGKQLTRELLGWGLAVAMSRSFDLKSKGTHTMVPLIDMANHSWSSNAETRSEEYGTVRMLANKRIEPGEPICLKYGSHSSRDLLLSYGFLMSDNPYDTFSIVFELEVMLEAVLQFLGGSLPPTGRATDGLKQWQRSTLQQLGLMVPPDSPPAAASAAGEEAAAASRHLSLPTAAAATGAEEAADGADASEGMPGSSRDGSDASRTSSSTWSSTSADGEGGTAAPVPPVRRVIHLGGEGQSVDPLLLAAMRVVLAQERKAVKGKTLEELGDWSKPLSPALEPLVMKALVGFCTVIYKAFPTSIQQDTKLLAELAAATAGQEGPLAGVKAKEQGHGGRSSPSLQLAVSYRLAKKRLLERVTKECLLRIGELTKGS